MTISVQDIATDIVAREGGYVNDPDDPGGPTKYGVTIHTMRRLGLDLDRNGVINSNDVKLLTVSQAVKIFVEQYFRKTGIWRLPEDLQATVFDMNVNAGGNSIKILQRLVNHIDLSTPAIAADGALGPKTAAKVQRAYDRMGSDLIDAYGIERRNYYFRIADRRVGFRKYARTRAGGKGGWIKRAEEFISAKHHMTQSEFKARTARWG